MQVPSILQGESLKRLLQGAAVGAVATMVVGFSWGGWSLGSTADKMAKEQSERSVVAALAPICADKFRALPDAEAKTIALSKVEAWKRGEEFPKEFVLSRVKHTRVPPSCTPALRCCLHRSQLRSSERGARNVIGRDHDYVLPDRVVRAGQV